MFIIEQAPQTRQIIWRNMDDGNDKWKLAFPYVVFIVVFRGDAVVTDQCKIFYRTAPLGGTEDIVSSTNLGNTNLNGYICTGSFRVDGETLAQKAESFVSGYWKSVFNTDIQESWNAHRNISSVTSLPTWQKSSEKNPFFPLSVKWREYGRLDDVIEGRC